MTSEFAQKQSQFITKQTAWKRDRNGKNTPESVAYSYGYVTKELAEQIEKKVEQEKLEKPINPMYHNIWFNIYPNKVLGDIKITSSFSQPLQIKENNTLSKVIFSSDLLKSEFKILFK